MIYLPSQRCLLIAPPYHRHLFHYIEQMRTPLHVESLKSNFHALTSQCQKHAPIFLPVRGKRRSMRDMLADNAHLTMSTTEWREKGQKSERAKQSQARNHTSTVEMWAKYYFIQGTWFERHSLYIFVSGSLSIHYFSSKCNIYQKIEV